jgi:hypothetical protein
MFKKILLIIFINFIYFSNSYADLEYMPLGKTYVIKDRLLIVSNNGLLDEIYLCKPTAGKCELINRAWSFEALAKECDGIKVKNIYFARKKEYFFKGGINENAPLRIYDLEGNIYGSAPDIDYAKSWCKFY